MYLLILDELLWVGSWFIPSKRLNEVSSGWFKKPARAAISQAISIFGQTLKRLSSHLRSKERLLLYSLLIRLVRLGKRLCKKVLLHMDIRNGLLRLFVKAGFMN